MIHELKCWPEFFRAIEANLKTFEVRKDDRTPRFEVGDTLRLCEWDPETGNYTGWQVERYVTYVLRDSRLLPKGTVVMSIIPRVPLRVTIDLPTNTDDDLRKLWRDHGGSFHGPKIETATMPEEALLPFLRKLISGG
jgi:hypothetical protein